MENCFGKTFPIFVAILIPLLNRIVQLFESQRIMALIETSEIAFAKLK